MSQTITRRRSIAETFTGLRAAKQIALMPFIPAGFPDLAATRAMLPALASAGASLIEIGFPFSDSIADGPVIQTAFTHALRHKIKVRDILDTVQQARSAVSIPIIAMVSYSIVFRYGPERFFADLSTHGFDAVIIPDLPPPEAQAVCAKVRAAGLDTVLLVSPTSPAPRQKEIAELSSGFIYCMSVAGVTGERAKLPEELASYIRSVKSMSNTPVCVGFGVSRAEHVKQLDHVADGAIVGTAYVRKMMEADDKSPAGLARTVAAYTKELLSQAR